MEKYYFQDMIKKNLLRINGKEKNLPSNSTKLENIKQFINEIIEQSDIDSINIYTIIKLLADKITFTNTLSVIETYNTTLGHYQSFSFNYLITTEDLSTEILNFFYNITTNLASFNDTININLGVDPILPTVWERRRLSKCLAGIGTVNNRWKEDESNHYIDLLLPIGISIVHGGNHSITTGMVKCEGIIKVGQGTHNNIYDISALYDFMKFDGTYYVRISDNSIICKANSFEFGCIFEIGRIIKDNNISFINHKINNRE
nr:DUF6710 family protein [uncultured Clostridium sp.]